MHTHVHASKGSQILINVFDWSALQNDSFDSHFNLSKAIVRLYKEKNTTKGCSKATLQAKVYCRHARGESEFTGITHSIDLSNGRNWEEVDLTEQLKSLWPIPNRGRLVYITITLKSQCAKDNLPIKLYNLKSISKLKQRRKLYSNQPVLCLYLNDDATEKLARNAAPHIQSIPSDEELLVPVKRRRGKRASSKNYCRKVDHIVNFKELDIGYIILPIQYNAGKCVGVCDYNFMLQIKENESHKVNNYVKLMAAQAQRRKQPEISVCCSPGEYDPLMLLIATNGGSSVRQKLFHEMRIRDCYCR